MKGNTVDLYRALTYHMDTGIDRLRRLGGIRPHIRIFRELERTSRVLCEIETLLMNLLGVEGLDTFGICVKMAPIRREKARLRVGMLNGICGVQESRQTVLEYRKDISKLGTW